MKIVNDRIRVNTWVHAGLHDRLIRFSKMSGKSKTQIVEEALDLWLTKRDKEF